MDHLNSFTRFPFIKIVNPRNYYKKEDLTNEDRYFGYWSTALDLDMKPALRKSLTNTK
jgi:hypothetical protein